MSCFDSTWEGQRTKLCSNMFELCMSKRAHLDVDARRPLCLRRSSWRVHLDLIQSGTHTHSNLASCQAQSPCLSCHLKTNSEIAHGFRRRLRLCPCLRRAYLQVRRPQIKNRPLTGSSKATFSRVTARPGTSVRPHTPARTHVTPTWEHLLSTERRIPASKDRFLRSAWFCELVEPWLIKHFWGVQSRWAFSP